MFRCRFVKLDSGCGLYGWSDYVREFSTAEEAIAAANLPMARGVIKQEAAELQGGKWVSLRVRERICKSGKWQTIER